MASSIPRVAVSLTRTVSRWTLVVPLVLAVLLLQSWRASGTSADAATVNLPCGSSLDAAYDAAQPGDVVQLSNCTYAGKSITGTKTAPGVVFDLAGSNQGSITLSGAQNVELRNGSGSANLGCQPGQITLRNYSQTGIFWNGVCNVSWIGGDLGPQASDQLNYIYSDKSNWSSNVVLDGLYVHDNHCVSGGCHYEAIRIDRKVDGVTIRNSVFRRNAIFHIFVTSLDGSNLSKNITIDHNCFDQPTGGSSVVALHDPIVTSVNPSTLHIKVTNNYAASGSNFRGPFEVSTGNTFGPVSACDSWLAAPSRPPVNSALPVVTGTPQPGQTLTSTNGTWTNSPTSYARQWRRCNSAGASCADIAGATGASYVLAGADAGFTVRVVVTATNADGSASATSAQTPVVTAVAPNNTVRPDLSGVAKDGQTLNTSNGTWTGTAPFSFGYSWRRCDVDGNNCTTIVGATGASYVVTPADVGAKLYAQVTATNSAGSGSQRTYLSAIVAGGAPVNGVRPDLSGVAKDGQTLNTSNGTWTGTAPFSFGYSWRRCDVDGNNCTTIVGATGASYVVTPADVGAKLYAQVTATNSAGSGSQRTYLSAIVAGGAPVNGVRPDLSGVAKDGQTLNTSNGTWTGTAPFSFGYSWRRCDVDGNNCTTIVGATGASYVVTPADVGAKLYAQVTATNSAGSGSQRTYLSAIVAP